MVDRRSIKPDLADIRDRKPDHQAAQRALACARRTDDCQNFAWFDITRDLAEDELSRLRREVTDRVDDHPPPRGREPRSLERRRVVADRFLQAIIGEPSGDKIAPSGNRKLHRRERASEKYGSRDHGAGVKLRVHHQPCADTKDRHLDEEAHELRRCEHKAPTSPERRKPSITVPFTAAQRSVMAGKMCMACTISALRIVASANSIASICLRLAVSLALRVAISFTMLNTNKSTAEESATNPSIGGRIQISATKMGTHGASKKALNPCVAMKFWIWEMSRS